jgi:hypothetical protein
MEVAQPTALAIPRYDDVAAPDAVLLGGAVVGRKRQAMPCISPRAIIRSNASIGLLE